MDEVRVRVESNWVGGVVHDLWLWTAWKLDRVTVELCRVNVSSVLNYCGAWDGDRIRTGCKTIVVTILCDYSGSPQRSTLIVDGFVSRI